MVCGSIVSRVFRPGVRYIIKGPERRQGSSIRTYYYPNSFRFPFRLFSFNRSRFRGPLIGEDIIPLPQLDVVESTNRSRKGVIGQMHAIHGT